MYFCGGEQQRWGEAGYETDDRIGDPKDPPERSVPRSIHLWTRCRLRGLFLRFPYGVVELRGLYAWQICGFNPFSSPWSRGLICYCYKQLGVICIEMRIHVIQFILLSPSSLFRCYYGGPIVSPFSHSMRQNWSPVFPSAYLWVICVFILVQ